MLKAIKIVIDRAEGPTKDCKEITVEGSNVWGEADAELLRMSNSAPGKGGKRGGYDKTDFVIHFEDGETYEGRYDLVHHDIEYPSLQRHILSFVGFHTGLARPSHLTEEQYDDYILSEGEKSRFDCCKYLLAYQIGVDHPKYIELREKCQAFLSERA